MLTQRSQVRSAAKTASWQRNRDTRSNSARAARERPAVHLETVVESVQPLSVPGTTTARAAPGYSARAKRGVYPTHHRSPSLPDRPIATDPVEHLQQRLRAELSLRQSHVPALVLGSRVVQTPIGRSKAKR
jgi:hypothetical protein